MATNRTSTLNVRVLPAEHAMLVWLAEREGVSISEWIRNTIRREHALATADRKKKGKRA